MLEGLDSVNSNNWNVELVTSQQISITFNVDLFERVFFATSGGFHRLLRFVT